MKNSMKKIALLGGVVMMVLSLSFSIIFSTTTTSEAPTIELTSEEKAMVEASQNGKPITIGIIPGSFPHSDCPPNTDDFIGLNIEILNRITEITGLEFEFVSVPVDRKTPLEMIKAGEISLVAGTIKLDVFLNNPDLLLSEQLSDGSTICIATKDVTFPEDGEGKVAMLKGYQAGLEVKEEIFPDFELITCASNQEAIRAVRDGKADVVLVSAYAGIYELQNPLNEDLAELTNYKRENESCIMGDNTPENQLAIAIIDKALSFIGKDGYDYMHINYSLSNPYQLSVLEWLYKYRYSVMLVTIMTIVFATILMHVKREQQKNKRHWFDPLTGALTPVGFEIKAETMVIRAVKPLYLTDFDISLFSSYNDLYGKEEGDLLLKNIAKIAQKHIGDDGILCRTYADHFKVLSTNDSLASLMTKIEAMNEELCQAARSAISFNYGVYPIEDNSVPIAKMSDFAALARKNAKESANIRVCVFDEELRNSYVYDAKMMAAFDDAIANKDFLAVYQPKFDTFTQRIIGAEALVRWQTKDGSMIAPFHFIDLFEKSGQIQRLDMFMLEEACIFLNGLTDKGLPMVPIAVNFSRIHLYNPEFVDQVKEIVERHGIPKEFIEIECTETTMINHIELTKNVFAKLQELGFTIAMDDFGIAYSSLNTLYAIPLDVLKLDRGFLMTSMSNERKKAEIIIKKVISLAHELSLRVVAEGVETEEQYLLLKELKCDYIQGYYFSKPIRRDDFVALLEKEPRV